MARYSDDLSLAHRLADTADVITMDRFRATDLVIDRKPDFTHVTEADTAVERALRAALAEERPDDGVLGEEFGEQSGGTPRRWVIDPIDGTANYVRGVPIWATLICLFDGDDAVVGVVSAPALRRRWWAVIGQGAFAGPDHEHSGTARVSTVAAIDDASISYSSLHGWNDAGHGAGMLNLLSTVWRSRAYGDFYSYVLLAEGQVDIAAEPEVNLWDLAAPSLIVTEAGGMFTDLRGEPGPAGGSAVATNGLLHDAVLAALRD